MMWRTSGGTGGRAVVLLHGMGATAAAWDGVVHALDARGDVRWLTVDLPGHGESDWQSSYSVGQLAVGVAEIWPDAAEVFVIGHSLGAYIALALASGWFRVTVRGVLGIGPKISWPAADLAAARELASRPIRWYATAEEAVTRFRRVAGLGPDTAPAQESLARGIASGQQGWRLAQDPRTFAIAGAPFASLAASAAGHVILARGEHDPMVSTEELRTHARDVHVIRGAGHNAHLEKPAAVIALLERLLRDTGSPDH